MDAIMDNRKEKGLAKLNKIFSVCLLWSCDFDFLARMKMEVGGGTSMMKVCGANESTISGNLVISW